MKIGQKVRVVGPGPEERRSIGSHSSNDKYPYPGWPKQMDAFVGNKYTLAGTVKCSGSDPGSICCKCQSEEAYLMSGTFTFTFCPRWLEAIEEPDVFNLLDDQ